MLNHDCSPLTVENLTKFPIKTLIKMLEDTKVNVVQPLFHPSLKEDPKSEFLRREAKVYLDLVNKLSPLIRQFIDLTEIQNRTSFQEETYQRINSILSGQWPKLCNLLIKKGTGFCWIYHHVTFQSEAQSPMPSTQPKPQQAPLPTEQKPQTASAQPAIPSSKTPLQVAHFSTPATLPPSLQVDQAYWGIGPSQRSINPQLLIKHLVPAALSSAAAQVPLPIQTQLPQAPSHQPSLLAPAVLPVPLVDQRKYDQQRQSLDAQIALNRAQSTLLKTQKQLLVPLAAQPKPAPKQPMPTIRTPVQGSAHGVKSKPAASKDSKSTVTLDLTFEVDKTSPKVIHIADDPMTTIVIDE